MSDTSAEKGLLFQTKWSSPIKQWFKENNCFITSESANIATHYLLDRGKISVPELKMKEFLKVYSEQVLNKQENFVCELKTPIFKCLMDLDFFEENELSNEVIFKYIATIQDALNQLFGKQLNSYELRVIISTTTSKKIKKCNKSYIKTGIHLIWPNLYIDTAKGLLIRKAVIQYLEYKHGKRPEPNTWEDVVDKCVFTTNGLRMVGSSKMSTCSSCKDKEKKRIHCDKCNGNGRMNEGRAYLPIAVIDGLGTLLEKDINDFQKNTFKMIKNTSIRLSEKAVINVKFIEPLPSWFNADKKLVNLNNKKKKEIGQETELEYTSKEEKKFKYIKKFDETTEEYNIIKTYIPLLMGRHYENIKILGIYLCGTTKQYYIVRTDSHYCLNKKGEHSNNHIYFVIELEGGISQKCFCECDVMRIYDKCKDFQSDKQPIPTKMRNLLYPTKMKEKKEIYKKNTIINEDPEEKSKPSNAELSIISDLEKELNL